MLATAGEPSPCLAASKCSSKRTGHWKGVYLSGAVPFSLSASYTSIVPASGSQPPNMCHSMTSQTTQDLLGKVESDSAFIFGVLAFILLSRNTQIGG